MRFIYFILLCLYIMGVIGGFGSAIYSEAYPCAVGVIVLAIFGWKTAKDVFKEFTK